MVEKSEVATKDEVTSAVTRKLVKVIDKSAEYGLSIDQEVKERMTEIATENVFFDYERFERDEPEIEFDEHAK